MRLAFVFICVVSTLKYTQAVCVDNGIFLTLVILTGLVSVCYIDNRVIFFWWGAIREEFWVVVVTLIGSLNYLIVNFPGKKPYHTMFRHYMYLRRSTCPTSAYLMLSCVKIVLGFKHCAVKNIGFQHRWSIWGFWSQLSRFCKVTWHLTGVGKIVAFTSFMTCKFLCNFCCTMTFFVHVSVWVWRRPTLKQ